MGGMIIGNKKKEGKEEGDKLRDKGGGRNN